MVILYLPVCGVGDSFTMSLPAKTGGKQAALDRKREEDREGNRSHKAEGKEKVSRIQGG